MTANQMTRGNLAARLDGPRAIPFVRKFAVYFAVGGACALIDIGVFSGILYLAGLHYLIAATLSFIVSTAINYVLCIRYVFSRFGRSHGEAIMLVYIASAIAIAMHLGILTGLVELFGIHPVLAKIAGIGAGFVWNFGSRYFWIFRG